MLNSTSGEVILNFDPLEGMKGHFEFVVTAIDPSGHLDAAKVKIYLIRYTTLCCLFVHTGVLEATLRLFVKTQS